MFHCHPFVLVLTLSFSLFSFCSFHWTSSYITIFSMSHPLSHSKPIHLLTSNLNTRLIIVWCHMVCRQVNLNFTCFSLFFPCLLTLMHKVQTVPVDSEPYKYHHPASLNSSVKAYWTLRRDVCKGEVCGSNEVTRVVIPLVTWSALEGNKSKKVTKTNVWVKIKRNGEYLQELEDNSKEIKERNVLSSNKDFECNRLQTKSGLRPNSRI